MHWQSPQVQRNWNVLSVESALQQRIVVIPDLHGDLQQMYFVLRLMRIINSAREWIAGNAKLVILGNMIDYGPESREIIEFIHSLINRAPEGNVYILNGDSEVQALLSSDVAISKNDIEREYHGDEKKRQADYLATGPVGRIFANNSIMIQVQADDNAKRGMFSGRKKNTNPILVFSHGDIHPQWSKLGVNGVNKRIWSDLANYSKPKQGRSKGLPSDFDEFFHDQNSPHHFYEISKHPDSRMCSMARQTLVSLQVSSLVMNM